MKLKADIKLKNKYLNIRCTEEDYEEIKRLADLYADGNISRYITYASINFKPRKKDLK